MISNRRGGFSLVEMVVVALLGSITLAAIYQALIVQEQAYRREGAIIATHESLRSAVGVLEAEMREVSATAQLADAGSDLAMIAPESLEFRALRKIGFVCGKHPSDKKLYVWELGAPFQAGSDPDSILVFEEGDSADWDDDGWLSAEIQSMGGSNCSTSWAGATESTIDLASAINHTDIGMGAPVRSFEWLTYGLYQIDNEWVLGRHTRDNDTIRVLVGGLAAPADSGLVFYYYDENGNETSSPDDVVRIQINVRSMADASNMLLGDTLRTNLFLRNN